LLLHVRIVTRPSARGSLRRWERRRHCGRDFVVG
jgi:hypothetical protein